MRSNLWKDLKVHIVLLIVSLLVICKFSDAPPIFDCLAFLFQYFGSKLLGNFRRYLQEITFYKPLHVLFGVYDLIWF